MEKVMYKRRRMTWKCEIPTWCAAVIAFLLPWQTRWIFGEVFLAGEHTEFGVMSVYVVELAVVVVAIGTATISLPKAFPSFRGRNAILWYCTLLVGLCALLSAAFASNPFFSFVMAAHVLFAVILFFVFSSPSIRWNAVCVGLVLGLFPSIVLGIFQFVEGFSPAYSWLGLATRDVAHLGDAVFTLNGERVLRAYGVFSHPNIFGGYLGVALFAWWNVLARMRSTIASRFYLLLGGIGTTMFVCGIVLTGSRSAFLGVALGVTLLLVSRAIKHRFTRLITLSGIAGAGIGLVLMASFAFPSVLADLRGGGVHEERSLVERAVLYHDSVSMIHAMNPFVGVGVGSYVLTSAALNSGKAVFEYQPVHNAYLLAFVEMGVIGFFALLGFGWSLFRILFYHLSRHHTVYALGMVTVVGTIAWFDHYLWSSWAGLALCAFACAAVMRTEGTVD
jgi:O-antigen ligase